MALHRAHHHLLAADVQRSAVMLLGAQALRQRFGPFGSAHGLASRCGFTGQLREQPGAGYALGNGYRTYRPGVLRFGQPDGLSPFGKGGLNAYAYAQADPVNFHDPSGAFLEALIRTATAVVGYMLNSLFFSLGAIRYSNFPAEQLLNRAGALLGAAGGAVGIASRAAQSFPNPTIVLAARAAVPVGQLLTFSGAVILARPLIRSTTQAGRTWLMATAETARERWFRVARAFVPGRWPAPLRQTIANV
ncbi:RHS repeat-associated core domain-containing protein [Pseudomonas sp. NPDC007930]|uniref:RHS repeat-associated core domain-containing protein n=1 Tax=Pseudomonas sp. NPDC007930 TaxID=3364417 RepID=UPI0036F061FC